MYLPFFLALSFLAIASPSEASILARGSEFFVHAATKAHRRAARHSAGLARDLRLSFGGLLAARQQSSSVASSRLYCVNYSGLPAASNATNIVGGGNPTTVKSGSRPSATTKPGSGTATGSQSSATSTSQSSPWKLQQQYVSSYSVAVSLYADTYILITLSKAALSSVDGISLPERIQLMVL